jgi:ABC-2 type transport system permease protein
MRKDLKLFLMDRRAVLMSVVAPIAIASFFGYIFGGGAGNTDNRIPALLCDLDNSPLSREIASRLESDSALNLRREEEEKARELVKKGKTTAAFVIPKQFGAGMGLAFLTGGKKPEIAILYDPSRSFEMRMLQGILTGAVMEAGAKQMGTARGSGGRISLPFEIAPQPMTARADAPYNGYAHSFGGMGIQFLLMVGVEVGVAILLRRQQGVWKRMRAAPLSRTVVLGSRVASSAVTSMATLMILFAFARVVFGVRIHGSLIGFFGICAAFSLMAAAFGLLIATFGKTAEATRALAILVTLLMVMLGGAWVPTFIFPAWLQKLTVVIPTRWAMDGLDAVTWRGLGLSAVAPQIGWLIACAAVFGVVAVMRFRWEAD